MNAFVKQLYDVIEKVSKEVNRAGGRLAPFSEIPRHFDLDSGPQSLETTYRYLRSYLEVISQVGLEIERPADRTIVQLESFLSRHGLKMGDSTFLNGLGERDLVEVYSLNHQQLFRNPEFFRISSYDLETLVFVAWHHLFWRHDSVQAIIIDVLNRVVEERMGCWPSPPIPQHILRECYGDHNRCIHYHMKKVGVVMDAQLDAPMGYVTVLEAFELEPGAKVSIL